VQVLVKGPAGDSKAVRDIFCWSGPARIWYIVSMEALSFDNRPALRAPVLILSFAGWSDAGAAATTAVRYLVDQLIGQKFAGIDPEEFYDFYRQRPVVRLNDQKTREIHWPSYDFYHGAGIGIDKDFIFGIGAEPHLRWRTFTETMLRFARECQVEMVLTLGAYLDEVLYTRPVPLSGFSTDPKLVEELDLLPSRYQGPTGIIGVLAEACRAANMPHLSLWASLPHYLSVSPNPRGTLALLLRLNQWLGLRVDTTPLERAAADFQAKINEAVNADPKLSAFVRELKKREFEQ
jgi:proteasome assembly chaperone (PAC2) family protein